jgi:hypothetical protein
MRGAAIRNARRFCSFERASIRTPSAVESTNSTALRSTTRRSGAVAASSSSVSRISGAL